MQDYFAGILTRIISRAEALSRCVIANCLCGGVGISSHWYLGKAGGRAAQRQCSISNSSAWKIWNVSHRARCWLGLEIFCSQCRVLLGVEPNLAKLVKLLWLALAGEQYVWKAQGCPLLYQHPWSLHKWEIEMGSAQRKKWFSESSAQGISIS